MCKNIFFVKRLKKKITHQCKIVWNSMLKLIISCLFVFELSPKSNILAGGYRPQKRISFQSCVHCTCQRAGSDLQVIKFIGLQWFYLLDLTSEYRLFPLENLSKNHENFPKSSVYPKFLVPKFLFIAIFLPKTYSRSLLWKSVTKTLMVLLVIVPFPHIFFSFLIYI